MTGDPNTICADDGQADPINVIVMMQNGGTNSAWGPSLTKLEIF